MKKKLYRSTDKRMLAGICGGLSDFFGIDVTIIRIIWAVLSLFYGIGIIIYIIAIFIIPNDPGYIDM